MNTRQKQKHNDMNNFKFSFDNNNVAFYQFVSTQCPICILHKLLTNNLAYILRERKGLAVSLIETML